jgi:hypothetical protein
MNKELFCKSLERIDEFLEKSNDFSDALTKVCDGHPVWDLGNWMIDALTDVLSYTMDDYDHLISSFVFERPLKIEITEINKVTKYNIETYEQLYDFLMDEKERCN